MLNNIRHIYSEIMNKTTKEFRIKLCIISVTTLLAALLFGVVYNYVTSYYEDKNETALAIAQVWEKTEQLTRTKNEGLSINFSSIDTDESIVKAMEKASGKLAERISNSDKDNNGTPDIEITPEIIPSDAFVTLTAEENVIEQSIKQEEEANNKGLIESGHIYLKDAYIGKYMSSSGQFETVIAQYKDNNIYVSPRVSFENRIETGFNTNEIEGYISESKYMSELKFCLISLYGPSWEDNEFEAKELISRYFTVECGDNLVSQISGYDNSIVQYAAIGYIAHGKSELDMGYIDRVYVQVELSIDDKRAYVDLELKLNSQGKIFDTDIL